MHRRDWLKNTVAAGAGLAAYSAGSIMASKKSAKPADAESGVARDKLPKLKIKDVKAILTAPAGIRLVVVKVQTNEPELYGLGCATFTQRPRTVETAVNKYLKPFLVGKNPLEIEDVWQSSYVSSYWRNGLIFPNWS